MSGPSERAAVLAAARGDEPVDLLLRAGRVVNVLSGEVEAVDVAVAGGRVVGLGDGYRAGETLELDGRYVAPGLIDAHVHIESSLASPREFARAVVPGGTTTVVTDPHEIANVHGVPGIEYMLAASHDLPLTVYVMASSCVPATPMGSAGAELDADDLRSLRSHPRVLGLAEVMNFPGVIGGDAGVWEKLEAFRDAAIDGHAPGVRGRALNAYALAGPGSDHESTSADEALEKLRRGLFVFLREATNARNVRDVLPGIPPGALRRVALCTDDRQPPDLLDEGGIDHVLRLVIDGGVDPVEAIRMATLNPAGHFGLSDRGAVAPGRRADLMVFDDLGRPEAELVLVGGSVAARDGDPAAPAWPDAPGPDPLPSSVEIGWEAVELEVPARDGRLRAIRLIPDQIVTGEAVVDPTIRGGEAVSDPGRDLLKIACVERHRGTGRTGLGFVIGFGLRRGALASTVAHDHHNLMVVGADDASMRTAARAVARAGGGLAAADGGDVLGVLPLPIAGLMSPAPIEETRRELDAVVREAGTLGTPLHDPFMALSFLGLEVIPSLKLTDRGLVDVDAFRIVDLWTS